MKLRNIRYQAGKCIVALFFLSCSYSQAQISGVNPEVLFKTIFDKNLKEISGIRFNTTVIVPLVNCTPCVKYFTHKRKNTYIIIFILKNESLLEIRDILGYYEVNTPNVYFTTNEYVSSIERIHLEPGPTLILTRDNQHTFYDYFKVDSMTNEFKDKRHRFLKP